MIMPYDFVVGKFGKHLGILLLILGGYIGGLLYAFGTHVLSERKPGQRAMLVGTVLTVLIGVSFHWFIGCVVGSVVGTLVGMWLESKMMTEVNKMSLEPPRYTKSKVMSATALTKFDDPEKWNSVEEPYGSAHCKDLDGELLNLPSIVRADTPTRRSNNLEPLALDDSGAPKSSALPDDLAKQALALPGSMKEVAGGSSSSRELVASCGRTSRKKKYAFSESTKIVVPQGTPGYQLGQSKWEGPPRAQVDYSSHLFTLPSSPTDGGAPTSPVSAAAVLSAIATPSAAAVDGRRWNSYGPATLSGGRPHTGSPASNAVDIQGGESAAGQLVAQLKKDRHQVFARTEEIQIRAPLQKDDKKKEKQQQPGWNQDSIEQSSIRAADTAGFELGRQGADRVVKGLGSGSTFAGLVLGQ